MTTNRPDDESLLNKLLRTRYPLTNYLYRQQEFIRNTSSTESNNVTQQKSKISVPQPPPQSSFNVPDTLDFNSSEDEMEHNSGLDDLALDGFDETLLLKNIDNPIHTNTRDLLSTDIQHSSSFPLEFSPYDNNSPVQKAIQNGLNIINQ